MANNISLADIARAGMAAMPNPDHAKKIRRLKARIEKLEKQSDLTYAAYSRAYETKAPNWPDLQIRLEQEEKALERAENKLRRLENTIAIKVVERDDPEYIEYKKQRDKAKSSKLSI